MGSHRETLHTIGSIPWGHRVMDLCGGGQEKLCTSELDSYPRQGNKPGLPSPALSIPGLSDMKIEVKRLS